MIAGRLRVMYRRTMQHCAYGAPGTPDSDPSSRRHSTFWKVNNALSFGLLSLIEKINTTRYARWVYLLLALNELRALAMIGTTLKGIG